MQSRKIRHDYPNLIYADADPDTDPAFPKRLDQDPGYEDQKAAFYRKNVNPL